LHLAKTKVLKKVWKKGVGFGAGKKDLSLKGLFPRPDSSNLIYRPLSGTAPFIYSLFFCPETMFVPAVLRKDSRAHPRRIPDRKQLYKIVPVGILQTTGYADMIFKHKAKFSGDPATGQKKDASKDFTAIGHDQKRQDTAKQNKEPHTAEKGDQIPYYLFRHGIFF
jgi:hypothetical protein